LSKNYSLWRVRPAAAGNHCGKTKDGCFAWLFALAYRRRG
jgi:hypothetical protein